MISLNLFLYSTYMNQAKLARMIDFIRIFKIVKVLFYPRIDCVYWMINKGMNMAAQQT